jgi:hypothetical protein
MTRRLADWARRPVVDSFQWGVLTRGDLLTIALPLTGLVLVVIAALSDG